MIVHRAVWCVAASVVMLNGTASEASVLPAVEAAGSYAVIVSAETAEQEEWKSVVDVLREKYDGSLILYPTGRVKAVLPELQKLLLGLANLIGEVFLVRSHRVEGVVIKLNENVLLIVLFELRLNVGERAHMKKARNS